MFTEQRIGEILKQLRKLSYPQSIPVGGWKMRRETSEQAPLPSDTQDGWSELPERGIWGGHCEYASFAAEVDVPPEFEGCCVEFCLLTGKEGQWDATNPQFRVYVDGVLRQGFDTNHRSIRLSEQAQAGRHFSIYLSAFTGVQNFHLLFQPSLRTVDTQTLEYYYDLLIPWQTLCLLEPSETAYLELSELLTKSINLLDLRKPGSAAYDASLAKAHSLLKNALYLKPKQADAVVSCVGHTHIDVAWLWTLAVTRDKAVRSFSTVLELMRRYPEYIFMSSQPQLYQYVKETAPEIYAQIRQRVQEGRWEPEGSMFVEADCNLASGEALVRQILYGKRFFREEFQKDNHILWLPDVFGYSAALPQIMKKSGIDYFMTTKISWNETNKLPYDTFYWKGIDGTKILTHFIPTQDYVSQTRSGMSSTEFRTGFTTNYNGMLTPSETKGAWQRYQQKKLNREVLCSYGYGDGGGPTEQMLEAQRRMAYGLPGMPATRQSTALEFFHRLQKDLEGKDVPTWTGELYLEYHRGTYTSMARNKRYNRRSEFAMTQLEILSTLAKTLLGRPYPSQMLLDNWQVLLRNQFHDILPGSAIWEVYEDSKKEYEQLLKEVGNESRDALGALAQEIGGTVVFNPTGQKQSGLVKVNADCPEALQQCSDGSALAWAQDVPAMGYARLTRNAPQAGPISISPQRVETLFAVISFNEKGQIASWYDKMGRRELLAGNRCGNVLMTYEDKPYIYDNWNIYDYYHEKIWPIDELVHVEVTENGPYRSALNFVWSYQCSTVEETMYFYSFSPRVDIDFHADWQEDQLLLKALFPLELNTSEATFEIQYGNVRRSTARNTSWDQARFEVCYHKWMDVSEGGFGVSFLNDCKYGVSVEENTVGLSLLKCGRDPNPQADREVHQAVYSILPHVGSWQDAGTAAQAYQLNNPMIAIFANDSASTLPPQYAPVVTDAQNIMLEVLKQAEDGDGTILRFYEFENCRTDVRLEFAQSWSQIWLCNLLEEEQTLLAEHTNSCTVPTEPFGIITLMLIP